MKNGKSFLCSELPFTQTLFRYLRIVAQSTIYLLHVRPSARTSVHVYHRGSHWTDYREIWYWGLFWKSVGEIPILLKSGEKIFGHFPWRPNYVSLLPATLNHHESVFLEWNGVRLAGQPRKCKRYSNAPHCYVVHKLPMLFVTWNLIMSQFLCIYLGLTDFWSFLSSGVTNVLFLKKKILVEL